MTGFLASVTNAAEAELVLDCADIVDLKNPANGALGALSHHVVQNIVRLIGGRKPVSATIGDLPMHPSVVPDAVVAMAGTGVDIVKVGLFGGPLQAECIDALAGLTGKCKIVAVLFADLNPDFNALETLADAGFYGAMLDTAEKSSGNLCRHLDRAALSRFVRLARTRGLLTGLAGSLRQEDVAGLVEIAPDYLGFRRALCADMKRDSPLEKTRVDAVAGMLRGCNTGLLSQGLRLQS